MLFRLLALLGSTLLTLGLFELAVRALGFGTPALTSGLIIAYEPSSPFAFNSDSSILMTLKPSYSGSLAYYRADSKEELLRIPIEISAQGLRGEDVSSSPPGGQQRLLGLGDSITFGQGVLSSETYLKVVETRLSKHFPIEILNAGVPAYNLEQEIRWFERYGLKFAPDVVTLGYFVNDLDPKVNLSMTQGIQSHRMPAPPWARWENGYRGVSHLANYLWRRYQRTVALQRQTGVSMPYLSTLMHRYRDPLIWKSAQKRLEHFASLCQENDIRCIVLLIPMFQLMGNEDVAQMLALVGDTCAGLGLEVLDLSASMMDLSLPEIWVLPGDPHPNARSHARMGAALASFLVTHPGKSRRSATVE